MSADNEYVIDYDEEKGWRICSYFMSDTREFEDIEHVWIYFRTYKDVEYYAYEVGYAEYGVRLTSSATNMLSIIGQNKRSVITEEESAITKERLYQLINIELAAKIILKVPTLASLDALKKVVEGEKI